MLETSYTPDTYNSGILTVSDLNREAKNLLADYFSVIKVQGEISNFTRAASGHIYFTLKDPNAQIRCAFFRGNQRSSLAKLQNGAEIIVTAQVGIYETRGDYQLLVETIEDAGEGRLRLAYEALKNKLDKEGLFSVKNKQPLPALPTKIGIITSSSGAALQDVLIVLKHRYAAIPIVVYPTSVQGDKATEEITKMIHTADRRAECDVLIIARGGGSLEDLWVFNEELVARAIYNCSIPIICGVGHETDVTIADFVADVRAPTPSGAAEIVSPDSQEWLNTFNKLECRITSLADQYFGKQKQVLGWLLKRLEQLHPKQQINYKGQSLDDTEKRLIQLITNKIHTANASLTIRSTKMQQYSPKPLVKHYTEYQKLLNKRLSLSMQNKMAHFKQQIALLSHNLDTVSPLATLSRGYSVVQNQHDEIITSSKQVDLGEVVTTRLAKGKLISVIKDSQHD